MFIIFVFSSKYWGYVIRILFIYLFNKSLLPKFFYFFSKKCLLNISSSISIFAPVTVSILHLFEVIFFQACYVSK